MSPSEYFALGNTGLPFSSSTGEMSNAASALAMAIHNVSYAIQRPGHARLPNPKTTGAGSGTLGSKLSCAWFRKRAGLNCYGLGYVSGSSNIALFFVSDDLAG